MKHVLNILYQPYKWLVFLPLLVINTVFFGLLAFVLASLVNQRIGSYWGGVVWSRVNSFLTPMFVSVKGKENIIPNTSYVVIANHQSYYDIFLIYGWLGLDIKWLMKQELRKIPFLGFASAKVGHIFIDRSNNKKALQSLEEAKKRLIKGASVVIFPEGTRNNTGEMRPFKRGAFKIAYDLKLPILPVTVIGTNKILPNNSLNLLPGKAKIIIHKPVDIKRTKESDLPELMNQIRTIISSALSD